MRLNNGFEIPQIGVGHLRQTLLMLLLCGVCFACNAPQQDDCGQRGRTGREPEHQTKAINYASNHP
jgi:hypothetical protein